MNLMEVAGLTPSLLTVFMCTRESLRALEETPFLPVPGELRVEVLGPLRRLTLSLSH